MPPKRTGWERAAATGGLGADGGFGTTIAGRGYYVWDEDAREAAQWARELGLSRPPDPAADPGDGEGDAGLR